MVSFETKDKNMATTYVTRPPALNVFFLKKKFQILKIIWHSLKTVLLVRDLAVSLRNLLPFHNDTYIQIITIIMTDILYKRKELFLAQEFKNLIFNECLRESLVTIAISYPRGSVPSLSDITAVLAAHKVASQSRNETIN